MRTDYHFDPPPPPPAAVEWLSRRAQPGEIIAWDELAASNDVPDAVREYAHQLLEAREDWETGAANRPITHNPDGMGFRLFGGPWQVGHGGSVSWATVEANFAVDGDGNTYLRRIADVSGTYLRLIAAGDEEGCRKLAATIYERMDKIGQLDRDLVLLVDRMEIRLAPCDSCEEDPCQCCEVCGGPCQGH